MKLRNLSGALRKTEGAPKVIIRTPIGLLTFELVKTAAVQALKDTGLDAQAETGLTVTESGILVLENPGDIMLGGDHESTAVPVAEQPAPVAAPAADPLAGLLG